MKNVAEGEVLFRRFVYENHDLLESDLRQHRIALHGLMHDGEQILFNYAKHISQSGDSQKVEPFMKLAEQKIKELFGVLIAWHGDLHSQTDVPEAFKTSIKQVAEGNIVDFKKP
jgi:hypothetical protein